jgi:class 3 adenylate cyclase
LVPASAGAHAGAGANPADEQQRRGPTSPGKPQTVLRQAQKGPRDAILPHVVCRNHRPASDEPDAHGAGIPQKVLAELEAYLPPDQWRELIGEAPRRGILLSALDRLRSCLYLLSTYLPQHLVQEKMRRPVPGQVRGQWLTGSLLFADVSGFTALSERLAGLGREGIEQLTHALNTYFCAMLDILGRSGGIVLKFAGDALLVYFSEREGGEQARWAVRAAQRMMAAMQPSDSRFQFAAIETPLGPVSLKMKIGVGTGGFLGASVGSVARMEYVILGETVARTMAAEGAAEAGLVVVDEATAACLDAGCCQQRAAGFYVVEPDPEADLGTFEMAAGRRRARGTVPWSANPHAIVAQMDIALRQIQALSPYLADELVEQIVARARQRQVESENRPATVAFVNLTGLEPLLAAWGREGVRKVTGLLDDYFRAMQRIVAEFGGVVSRIDPYSRGSKMLILFGAPIAHEDDPLRAVSAALAMGDELARLNDRWRRRLAGVRPAGVEDGRFIEQRIGISQGPTFAGQAGSATRREYTVMGDDVNLAARLMAAGQPGQILLSQRVYDAVVDHFTTTALPPIRVKGKSQPIAVYEPVARRDDPLARRLRRRATLVGRDAEMERVCAVLHQVQRGKGTILTIQGPAGIGKSHLADRLTALALARGFRAVLAPCQSFNAGTAYAPWIATLRALLEIGAGDDIASRQEKLWRAVEDLRLADECAEALRALLEVPPLRLSSGQAHRDARARIPVRHVPVPPRTALFSRLENQVSQASGGQQDQEFDLWRLVRQRPSASSQDRPFEPSGPLRTRSAQDKHTGQPQGTWHTLQAKVALRQQVHLFRAVSELLAGLAAREPLLLYFESAQWLDAASRQMLDYLGEPLQRLRVLVLVVQRNGEGQAGTAPLPGLAFTLEPLAPQGTAALIGHLLGETVDDDLARAIHVQSGGNPLFIEEIARWLQGRDRTALDDLRHGLGTSSTVQELVLSHLDSLPLGQRDTLKAASVIGTEFRFGEVRALSTASDAGQILHDNLAGLEDARLVFLTENGGDAGYTFWQTVVREVGYQSQPVERRRELHGRLAAYLEAQGSGPRIELLAHHYEAAGSFLPAARYLLLSGHKARERYAHTQATAYYQRALVALKRLPPVERDTETRALSAQIHEALGDAALLNGDFAASVVAYRAARAEAGLAQRPGSSTPARLLLKLALTLPTQGQESEAEACARQAWMEHDAGTELATVATLAWLLWRAGRAEAGKWIEQGRGLAAQDGTPWAAGVAALLADLAGDWAAAQQAYLSLEQPAGAALAKCRQGDEALGRREIARALTLYGQAAEIWGKEKDGCGLSLARYRQAEAHLLAGEAAKARVCLLEAKARMETSGTATDQDRQALQTALHALESNQPGPWPSWCWQPYVDALRIAILFRS